MFSPKHSLSCVLILVFVMMKVNIALSQPTDTLRFGTHLFVSQPVPQEIQDRMMGKSMPENATISFEELRYLTIPYYDFNSQIQIGEMVCNQSIALDLLKIFRILFSSHYQINSIRLVDDFDGSDELSMEANNTSCFNYRHAVGQQKLSKHALGLAVDINPMQNPLVRHGKAVPPSAEPYVNRTQDFPHKIDTKDRAYSIFHTYGFTWGGLWRTNKDYQHFEKVLLP